jgi:hypothetical protein
VIYSDCVSNLLMYLGAEPAVLSENLLKSLRIRADFDSTIRRFDSPAPASTRRAQLHLGRGPPSRQVLFHKDLASRNDGGWKAALWPVFDHERIPELQHRILKHVPRDHGCRQRKWKPGEK